MYNLLGFLVASGFIYMAMGELKVESSFYFDEIALLVVGGGTLSALIISFPPQFLLHFIKAPYDFIKRPKLATVESIKMLIEISLKGNQAKSQIRSLLNSKKLDPFLMEGAELLTAGLPFEDFKGILTERIYRNRQRDEQKVDLFRRLAKYPPAFGLVGTVLGLISLMRSVGQGANPGTIGLNMALALIATLYGLAFANFVLAPIAENFQKTADDRKVFCELLLEGLLMIHQKKSPIAVQEMLNSFVETEQRVDVLGLSEGEAA